MLLVVVNVPGDYSIWPVLKVIMYGRFCVTAKGIGVRIKGMILS